MFLLCNIVIHSYTYFTFSEEIEDLDSEEEEEEEEEEVEDEEDDSESSSTTKERSVLPKTKITSNQSRGRQMQSKGGITSPRARITNLTSIAAKKKNASRLTVRKGRIYKTSLMPTIKQRDLQQLKHKKLLSKQSGISPKVATSNVNKRKREQENLPISKKFIKTKEPAKLMSKKSRNVIEAKGNKKGKRIVEKKEIEKVLQVNKEVMTQLLNFGAEVAEAMASNNESIFSFSTKDNPLETFKIDKQDDFSDEEVVKIIKWFEEEEEQRRAYRKRILEALRASHETNMSLYTQMLKMLQSVTAC